MLKIEKKITFILIFSFAFLICISLIAVVFIGNYNSFIEKEKHDINKEDYPLLEKFYGFSFTEGSYLNKIQFQHGKDSEYSIWIYGVEDKQEFLRLADEYKSKNLSGTLNEKNQFVSDTECYCKTNTDFKLYFYEENNLLIVKFYFVGYPEDKEVRKIFK